ncbi:MAG: hypothetical protein KR126chlam5_00881 [Candidatus Anoxychlamydiales bacterium]|nr:hypothetical protein [Candidatus Anoxychlamydiales bacterium]NGX52578.1 hypothetical protein [Candidatus Anoxychlamydiales bacterium]
MATFLSQLLLFCILVTQSLFIAIIRFEPETTYKFAIPVFVSIIAFFCAPIQGGLSDYYCRKKALIFALLITLISSVFFLFWVSQHNILYLIIYIVMFGVAGNVNPIVLSAYKDISKQFMNFRFFMAMVLFYYFVGDFSHVISRFFVHSGAMIELSYFLLVICILLVYLVYKDAKDVDLNVRGSKDRVSISNEVKYIYHNFLKHKSFMFGFLGYLFLELSIYQFTFRNEAFRHFLTRIVPAEMIVGVFIGVLFLKFAKFSDEKIFLSGLITVLICFLILFFSKTFGWVNRPLLISTMIILATSYSIAYSSVYCLFTRKRHHHDHGKVFGMLASADYISYLIAIGIVALTFRMPVQKVWLISLFMFVIGAIFFLFFLHHDKKISKQS